MSIHDITPETKSVPDKNQYKPTLFLIDLIDSNTLFKELANQYKFNRTLNQECVYDMKWNTDLLKTISARSYPLESLLDSTASVPIDKEWLCYWELYSHAFVVTMSDLATKRIENANEKARIKAHAQKTMSDDVVIGRVNIKATPIRSFHMYDIAKSSITSLQKSINKIEYNVGTQIGWNWLGTYHPDDLMLPEIGNNPIKEKNKWSKGVDGEGNVTIANMRSWKNKIDAALKLMDVFIYNDHNRKNNTYVNNAIIFALLNTNAGGFAYIRLSCELSSSLLVCIQLFTNCFERTKIVHTVAEDAIFLVGEEFLNNMKPFHKSLYEFCEITGDLNVVPLTAEYCRRDHVTNTIEKIVNAFDAITEWRLGYYEKVLKINSVLTNSTSAKTFDSFEEKYISEQYPDYSDVWVTATNFQFLVGNDHGKRQ